MFEVVGGIGLGLIRLGRVSSYDFKIRFGMYKNRRLERTDGGGVDGCGASMKFPRDGLISREHHPTQLSRGIAWNPPTNQELIRTFRNRLPSYIAPPSTPPPPVLIARRQIVRRRGALVPDTLPLYQSRLGAGGQGGEDWRWEEKHAFPTCRTITCSSLFFFAVFSMVFLQLLRSLCRALIQLDMHTGASVCLALEQFFKLLDYFWSVERA